MEWLGRAKLEFHAAPDPVAIKEKDGLQTDVLRIVEKMVPPCQLNPLLFNGHLQTCWTAFAPHGPPLHYKRKIFEAGDRHYAGSFAVDFYTKDGADEVDESLPPRTVYFGDDELRDMASDDARPMLVVLHGLSGGSHEVYLRFGIAPLLESGEWEACVINSRGCAHSKITSGILYNARATWDTRQVVRWLRSTFPNRPLFGIGFSLGACILTTYMGEEGSSCELKAAIGFANPWNLEVSNKALKRTLVGHQLYHRVLGSSMSRLVAQHKKEIIKYTDLDFDEVSKCTYLYEFDRVVQCGLWGYPSEDCYYRDASSVDSVLAIRTPYLAINSTDDPLSNYQSLPYGEIKANPYTVLCTTSLGGHLGWFEFGGGRWHCRPITNFLNHMAFKVDHSSIVSKATTNGVVKSYAGAAAWDPMRRKMDVSLD